MIIPMLLVLLSADSCATAALLPAYAHNDYRNRRPLHDALELGYRGVEADVFRVGTELVVGHDRGALRGAGTLSRLYLAPLRERLHTCGHILNDSTPLFLSIELKEADPVAFQYLLAQLREFEELFTQTGGPAVQVTLVGWWPSPDSVAWPEYLRVQLAVEQLEHIPVIDGARVGFVSVDYEKFLRWRGVRDSASVAQMTITAARELARTLRKPLRVHHAPADLSVYTWLLWQGVTLIGTTQLARSRSILAPFVTNARPRSFCCEE
jgi:hypothetical protein